MSIKFENNTKKVLSELEDAKEQILFEWGEMFVNAWRGVINKKHVIDTGRFKNSTDHIEDDNSTYIGTSLKEPPYPIYLELGTQKMKSRPTLRPAIIENVNEAKKIAENIIKK